MQDTDSHPTAELVLTAICARLQAGRTGGPTRVPAPAAEIRRLAQDLGEEALRCVSDTLGGRREALVQGSATVIEILAALWAACALTPDEIWTELHKREQLGSLLMQLNQAQAQAPRRLLKPWRVDSTKLP